jgi:hypothetical protein
MVLVFFFFYFLFNLLKGTFVGDPVECKAIGSVLSIGRPNTNERAILIGSVKTNVGHLEPAGYIFSSFIHFFFFVFFY